MKLQFIPEIIEFVMNLPFGLVRNNADRLVRKFQNTPEPSLQDISDGDIVKIIGIARVF